MEHTVRPTPIDSNDELLAPPAILLEFMDRYGAGEYPVHAAVAGLVEELGMDDAESIQFGNTAFISHYDGDVVFMRALNVDTAKNLVDNIENYVMYVFRRGVKTIFTNYTDPVVTSVIRTVFNRIRENNKGNGVTPELEFDRDDAGEYVAAITLHEGRGK